MNGWYNTRSHSEDVLDRVWLLCFWRNDGLQVEINQLFVLQGFSLASQAQPVQGNAGRIHAIHWIWFKILKIEKISNSMILTNFSNLINCQEIYCCFIVLCGYYLRILQLVHNFAENLNWIDQTVVIEVGWQWDIRCVIRREWPSSQKRKYPDGEWNFHD